MRGLLHQHSSFLYGSEMQFQRTKHFAHLWRSINFLLMENGDMMNTNLLQLATTG